MTNDSCLCRDCPYRQKPNEVVSLPGGVSIDVNARRLIVPNGSIRIEPALARLLAAMGKRFGVTLHRDVVFAHLGCGEDVEDRVIPIQVCKLRKVLRRHAPHLQIVTAWGEGYRLTHADPEIAPVAMAGGLTAVSSQTCAAGSNGSAAAFSGSLMADEPEFVLEKGVPLPTRKAKGAKYPFPDMEVGDSLFFPADMRAKFGSCHTEYGKRHGMKFTLNRVKDGFRCWRIA